MKSFLSFARKRAFLLSILLYLAIHLAVINDYGFTWDFHYHFFGGGHLLGLSPQELEPRNLPFVEPDPRRAVTLPYGAIMSVPPVATYLLLHKTWNLLPADSAYHLPVIIWGIAGVAILFSFMREAFGTRTAWLSALFIAFMPRYFGDMHNNMKDIPSAVAFTLNVWLLWRLVRYKRVSDLLLAVAAFTVAFNVKINAVFIPIVFAAWLLLQKITNHKHQKPNKSQMPISKRLNISSFGISKLFGIWNLVFVYFALAPLAAFALWALIWPNPLAQLDHAYRTFGIGTNNIEVLLNGNWYCSGSTVPWFYPVWYLAITTPLPVLAFFLLGIFSIFIIKAPITKYQIPNKSQIPITKRLKFGNLFPFVWNLEFGAWNFHSQSLLILWFTIPLTRYFLPSVGVIDGIRHFEEVLFPLAAIAAIGLDHILSFVRRPLLKLILWVLTIFYVLFTVYSYHPYQITYFNDLVGGAKGALGKYDLDYWGTSQKAAVEWVNEHAPENANVHIVMSAPVAGQYLRQDLIPNLNKYGYDESDFVVVLNRQSFFYRFHYVYEYLLHHTPAYTVEIQGAPLTWVFDNRTDNTTPRQKPWWQGEDPCIIKYWRGETSSP